MSLTPSPEHSPSRLQADPHAQLSSRLSRTVCLLTVGRAVQPPVLALDRQGTTCLHAAACVEDSEGCCARDTVRISALEARSSHACCPRCLDSPVHAQEGNIAD